MIALDPEALAAAYRAFDRAAPSTYPGDQPALVGALAAAIAAYLAALPVVELLKTWHDLQAATSTPDDAC